MPKWVFDLIVGLCGYERRSDFRSNAAQKEAYAGDPGELDKEKTVSLVSVKPLEELTHVEFDVSTYNEDGNFFEGGKITVVIPGDISGKPLTDIGAMGRLRLKVVLEKLNDQL